MDEKMANNTYKPQIIGSPIFIHYFECCRELKKDFYGLVKHDLKNDQNSILMALDLFRMKNETKYLDMISEASYKSLDYIDRIKELELHLFESTNVGFYSCKDIIQKSIQNFPNATVSGDDCFVFADFAIFSTFELLFSYVLNLNESTALSFSITSFMEDNFLKCKIDLIIPVPVPSEFADIFTNPNQRITGGLSCLSAYTVKQILNRYSGSFSLIENSDSRSVYTIILYQESDEFNRIL
jgi:hypothetical protein